MPYIAHLASTGDFGNTAGKKMGLCLFEGNAESNKI
jgi:hypothetical protein